MSLPVGIHENLILSKAERNDQGTLVIAFKQVNVLDMKALNSGSTSMTSGVREQDFMIFPPRLHDYDGKVDTFSNLMTKIGDIMAPLNHILQQYMKTDDIAKGQDMFKDTGLTAENIQEKLPSEAMLAKVYNNIVNQFIALIKPYVNSPEKMRMVFIRKSKASHFPSLRKRFLDTTPFIERMSVPAPRVRFSKYELDNGLNDPTPVDQPGKPSGNSKAEMEDVLFGATSK